MGKGVSGARGQSRLLPLPGMRACMDHFLALYPHAHTCISSASLDSEGWAFMSSDR